MKTTRLFLVAVICLMQSVTSMADDRMIPVSQLPAAVKTFVANNFPGKNIAYAEKDVEFMGTKYEVMLNDGAKIDFDKKGNWDKVDCETYAVPAALIPASIAQYVKTNFPGTIIIKIDKERYGYDIELSNDIELKFNQSGALVGMDD